jgi:hypothetical protein
MPFDEKKWKMTFDEALNQLDEQLCVVEDGEVLCCIGLRATFYFFKDDDPEVRRNILRVFERYVAETKGHLRWGATPKRATPKKLQGKDAAIADPRTWEKHLGAEEFCLVFHGAEKGNDASPYSFIALARQERPYCPGWVTLTLPLSWLKGRGPEGFSKLVVDCCRILRPYHGYAGLSLIQHVDEGGASPAMLHMQGLAFRFLGLEVDFPEFHADALEKAIKGVNWLTILEDSWLPKVGGREKLEKELGEGFVFHEYPGGVVVQAGPRPLFGDVNWKEDLPHYKKLARALKPIRVEYDDSLGQGGVFDVRKTREWFNRFDKDK